jgi:hypothetical protein
MSKLYEITKGWKNYIFKNPHVEKVAYARASICAKCPELNESNKCSKCGCFMPVKTRSMDSKCPLNNW